MKTIVQSNPLITAIRKLIQVAKDKDVAHHSDWKEAIEMAKLQIAACGDVLRLTDESVVTVVKSWHGKDSAWITVTHGGNRMRDVELYEIADTNRGKAA